MNTSTGLAAVVLDRVTDSFPVSSMLLGTAVAAAAAAVLWVTRITDGVSS